MHFPNVLLLIERKQRQSEFDLGLLIICFMLMLYLFITPYNKNIVSREMCVHAFPKYIGVN